jgi:PHP family Zn ribbon phosphoesterase
MSTVNCVSKIKNELAREFHEQNLADFKKKFYEALSKTINATEEKKLEAQYTCDNIKQKYNQRLREYIATHS